MFRVAFIFTHRIQYFTNLMDELQRRGNCEVAAFFAHETSKINDAGFSRRIEWDNRRQAGYREIVLADSARRKHGPFFNSFSRELFARLNEFDPDVVHLNGYYAAIQWQARFWAARRKVPLVARGDGDTLGGPRRSRQSPQMVLSRRFTRRLAHVFYQGIENRRFWLARGASPEKMSWVPCVSDGLVFRKKAFAGGIERDAFRAAHHVNPQDVVFAVSGKLEQRKRPADAIEALACCGAENVRLWFLGSGPLETELKKLAALRQVEDKITWFGFRNQTELPAILQAADVLLHPSGKDPWPYSILEGAISGLALLLSDKIGSHPDWIGGAGAGRIYQAGDIEDLASALKFLVENSPIRQACQQAAKIEATKYTEEEFCSRFEGVVGSLVARKAEGAWP